MEWHLLNDKLLFPQDFCLIRPAIYGVALPIGNMLDFSIRGIMTLRHADLLLVEDTRKAGLLLSRLMIKSPKVIAYHDHNEASLCATLIRKIKQEELAAAILSDAGTPAIADPGFRLFREAHRQGVPCVPVPGPSALLALISVAGLPTDRISFVGFLPAKSAKRLTEIRSWQRCQGTIIFFETALRILGTLAILQEVLADCQIAIGRELTKIHEEIKVFANAKEAEKWVKARETVCKGEFAIAIDLRSGASQKHGEHDEIARQIRILLSKGLSSRDIGRELANQGIARQQYYPLILAVKAELTME
jgi:16S rRNA (cytidine1402-2'-O)-methyltransferase